MLFRGACTRVGVMKTTQTTIPLANIASGKGKKRVEWVNVKREKTNKFKLT